MALADVPTHCKECGDKLYTRGGWQSGLCDPCRGVYPDEMWWKKNLPVFVVAYPTVEALNEQAALVGEDYTITAISATSGRFNFGRAALGFAMAGAIGAAVANPQSEGAIIVAWTRRR